MRGQSALNLLLSQPPKDRRLPALCIVLCLAVCASHAASDEFAIIVIPGLGGTSTSVSGINNSGLVVGSGWVAGDEYYRPFVYRNGNLIELAPLDGSMYAGVADISEARYVVGGSEGGPKYARATLWPPEGSPIDLGDLGGDNSYAAGINESLEVVGTSDTPIMYEHHAFVWHEGVLSDLGTLGGTNSAALAINESGIIVGLSNLAGDEYLVGCYWEDGLIHELPGLGGIFSKAHGINDRNQIVGYARSVRRYSIPMLWQKGWMRRLAYPYAYGAAAEHINNNGVILGWMYKDLEETYTTPIIWPSPDDMAASVYKLLPPHNRWGYVAVLADVNDLNQIVGNGNYGANDGPFNRHAFLLTPVYPSFDLTDFEPGIVGQLSTIEAHNVQPGATVHFLGSRYGGGALIPTCDVTKNALQLDDPHQLGTAIADANGVARIEGVIPERWGGQEVLFQAYIRQTCEISNLVVQTFE